MKKDYRTAKRKEADERQRAAGSLQQKRLNAAGVLGIETDGTLTDPSLTTDERHELKEATDAALAEKPYLQLIRGDKIRPEPVYWLWPKWLPQGKISLSAGMPEIGKTTVLLDLAARVTRGRPMPDGTEGDPDTRHNVLIFSAEDDAADTLIPRLIAAGADMRHVFFEGASADKDGMATSFNLRDHLAALKEKIAQVKPRLIIFDPLTAYVGKIDTHRESEIRQLLRPIVVLAAALRITVVGVAHVNKPKDLSALMRITGSAAWGAAARSVLGTVEDPAQEQQERQELQAVVVPVKHNLAPDSIPLGYKIETVMLDERDGLRKAIETTRIRWLGPRNDVDVRHELESAGRSSGKTSDKLQEGMDFIRDELASGRVKSRQIFEDAAERGIAEKTINRAKRELHIDPRQIHRDGKRWWEWSLP
jgi:putative DNA primase/helicase